MGDAEGTGSLRGRRRVKRFFESAVGTGALTLGLLLLAFAAARDAALGLRRRESRGRQSRATGGTMEGELPGEFCFERAIQGYETLIDRVAVEKRG